MNAKDIGGYSELTEYQKAVRRLTEKYRYIFRLISERDLLTATVFYIRHMAAFQWWYFQLRIYRDPIKRQRALEGFLARMKKIIDIYEPLAYKVNE